MQPESISPQTNASPQQVSPIQPTSPAQPQYPLDKKRSKKPLLLILLAILLIVIGVYGIYYWQHKKVSDSKAKLANLQSQVNKLTKQIQPTQTTKTSSTTGQTSNPYSGWKTHTLTYEKLTFMYPPTWTVTDQSNSTGLTPDTDQLSFTGSGFQFSIDDGWNGSGDPLKLSPENPIPINFVGSTDYLVFLNPRIMGPNDTRNPNSTGSALLLTGTGSPNYLTGPSSFPLDKNVNGDPNINNGGNRMLISGGYSGTNAKTFDSVALAENDPAFKNLVLVIRSMHY
jgi:hypothetical protein